MPPKRLQLAQAARDSFPEDVSAGIIERWATSVVPGLESFAKDVHAKRQATLSLSAASAAATPPDVVQALSAFQETTYEVFTDAETIRTVIAIRVPELKEEDNLGVGVQMAVLKQLDSLQSKLLGGSGGGDDKGGAPALAGMFSLKAYFAARGAVEDKLLGKPDDKEGKDGKEAAGSAGSKAPSTHLELKQTDADALLKVELAATQLSTQLRALVNTYALNWKKLIQPRVSNDKMVS